MSKIRDDYWFENLKKEYPELLSGVHYASIGKGWNELVSNLCYKIAQYQKNVKDPSFEDPVVVQIKEKFGGLRFYFYGGDDYIRGMVDFAESMSFSICEDCSKPGGAKGRGWVRTLCEDCDQKEVSLLIASETQNNG